MRLPRILSALCLLGLVAGPALAGDQLSIRLVHASNQQQGNAAGLEDVLPVLKGSLPYTHFRLVSSSNIELPASGNATLDGYTVQCNGPQNGLKISVLRGGKVLLNTSVSLNDGHPFVLGGLPSDEGKLVLVFVAR